MLEAQAGDFEEEELKKLKIGWGTVFGNKSAVMALACIFSGTYNIMFYASWIEVYFTRMGDEDIAGNFILA